MKIIKVKLLIFMIMNNPPSILKTKQYGLGDENLQIHLLEDNRVIVPVDDILKFKDLIMTHKISDKQARDFSNYIASLTPSDF